ncbi:MAG TPA: PKD domain-containing protein [Methanospirillum sp.]|nr:PKD domain-containing protein [Methanospirillum sp.]
MTERIRIFRSAFLLVILLCTLILSVSAVPPLPAEFYGGVTIQGTPAPIGTVVVAKINDQVRGQLSLNEAGKYGHTGIFDERLVVAATDDDLKSGAAVVTFLIGSTVAEQTVPFEPGKTQKLDLSAGGVPPVGPVADFKSDVVTGKAPLSVSFTDLSQGSPVQWTWDFGDGSTSDAQSPVHIFSSTGTYTITLTVVDAKGASDAETKVNYINVTGSGLQVQFNGSPLTGNAPLSVQFTDLTVGTPTMWSWEFGDGGTDSIKNPIHVYANPGTYSVTLIASDQSGLTGSAKKEGYIVVSSTGSVVADFSAAPTSGTAPLTVQFTDLSIGSPTMWSWDFGDGGTGAIGNPSHTYTTAGTYTVKLIASSQTGGSSTKVKEGLIMVSGSGAGPKAAFSVDKRSGPKPLTVQFTDSSTGGPTMWFWNFGDGSNDTVANPSHTYQQAGVFTVALTASNTAGSDTKTEKDFISVTGDIPPPVAMFEASPISGSAPLSVQFKDLSIGPPTSYYWDFGDASVSSEANPVHIYNTAGSYTVTLTVANSGGSHTMKRENYIGVTSPGQIVTDFSGTPTSGPAPLSVQFTDMSTGGPTMWSWEFGDGGTATIGSPSHTYTNAGTYTVNLTASSQTGGSNKKIKTGYIIVSSPGGIAADFSATPTSGAAPLTVQFTDLSTGGPTMWSWDFGDGGTAMIGSPSHTYMAAGTYSVKLTASSQTGGSSTKVKEGLIVVTSSGQIIADFMGTPTSGSAPLTVQFSDRSSGGPTMWSWDFGDGGTDTIANPSHVYRGPGTFTVKMTASNTLSSNSVTKSGYITTSQSGPGGAIKITYAPDRSQVYLNNQLQGETKFLQTFKMENLPAGLYQLRLNKPGFEDYSRDIPVGVGRTTEVIADMRIKPTSNGILSVYTYPAGSSVYVDGVLAGTGPLWLADVTPGVHALRVTAQDYLDWNQQIMVVGGGGVTYVTAPLYPSWWTPMYGYVMVSSMPGNAVTFIDGVPQGSTPLTISQVKPGVHTIRIELPGYAPWEQQVTVMEGRTAYAIAQMNQGDVIPMSVKS